MKINQKRFNEVKNNPHYLEERDVLREIPDGQAYYEHIIKHVELDPRNAQNSYIMWAFDKVDELDQTKPCKFVSANYTLPDIDVDFPPDERDNAIKYVREKYGYDNTCQIITFARMMGRAAVRAVMQVEGYPKPIIDDVTKDIPDEAAISDKVGAYDGSVLKYVLHEEPKLISDYVFLEGEDLQGEFKDVFRRALALEGRFRSKGKHAAGFIISGVPINSVAPMEFDKEGELIAAFDMGDLEKVGLVKFDFLGVDVLAKLEEVLGTDLSTIPLDDPDTFELISSGNTKGCFQLESYLGAHWCKEIKPEDIDGISDIIALIRPGSLNSVQDGKNMIEHYRDRKFGVEEVPKVDQRVDAILEKTYGVILGQEQAMLCCRAIAGFNMAQATRLRKAAGKKSAKLMAEVKEEFLEGCKKNNVSQELADYVFNMIESSNRYSFNFSHSVSYAYLTYFTAYAKTHHKLEFYRSWLNHAKNKIKPFLEIATLCSSAKLDNVEILPPKVKYGNSDFAIVGDSVAYGLSHVKNASEAEVQKLLELQGRSETDYLVRVFPQVNKRTVESLIAVGAFDLPRTRLKHLYSCSLDLTGKEIEWIAQSGLDFEEALPQCAKTKKEGGGASNVRRIDKILDVLKRVQNPGRDLSDNPIDIISDEERLMGVALSYSYIDGCTNAAIANTTCKEFLAGKNGKMILVVRVKKVKEHETKKGTMAFLTVEDECEMDMICFADKYEEYMDKLYDNNLLVVIGERGKKGSFIVDRIVEA